MSLSKGKGVSKKKKGGGGQGAGAGTGKKKKGKGGKTKAGKAAAATTQPGESVEKRTNGDSAVPPSPESFDDPLPDPWKAFKSPFGGRMSPADEYRMIEQNTYGITACIDSKVVTTSPDHITVDAHVIEDAVSPAQKHRSDGPPSQSQNSQSNDAAADVPSPNTSGDAQEEGTSLPPLASPTSSADGAALPMDKAGEGAEKRVVAGVRVDTLPTVKRVAISRDIASQIVTLEIVTCGLHALTDISPMPHLRVLSLAGNNLTDFPDVTALPKLLHLDLSFNPIGSLNGLTCVRQGGKMCVLRNLILRGLPVTSLRSTPTSGSAVSTSTPSASEGASPLASLTNLQEIDVSCCRLDNTSSLKVFSRANFPRLTSVNVRGNPMTESEAFAQDFSVILNSFSTLKFVNGSPFAVKFGTSQDALAEFLSRSIEDTSIRDGTRLESCSCIEGNPCATPYTCRDWENRFEVAKRAREENYNIVF